MELVRLQEELLRAEAAERKTYADLMYFHAARRDLDALRRLRDALDPDNRLDALVFTLLAGEGEPPRRCEAAADGSSDPWALYTLIKYWLGRGEVEAALAVAADGLRADARDTGPLFLMARYAACRGDSGLATELIDRVLRLNPSQQDVEALSNRLGAGETIRDELYLDVLPKAPPITFYIPAFNVEAYIETAILGLLAQNYPIQEILVIDDGSMDGSIELARKYPVRIVRHGENLGLAAARNTAFRHARTPCVGAIDTDAVPDVHYTQYAMMELENAAREVCGAGGRLVELHVDTPADRWRARHMPQTLGPARKLPADTLFGSNTVFLREAVLGVGGYDERRRTNGEDTDLCRRLRAAGRPCVYTPYAVACHARRDTVSSVLRTVWNWAFWTRHELGVYADGASILRNLPGLLQSAADLMQGELESGNRDLVYIDFLYLFAAACRDLRYGVEQGFFTAAQGRAVQQALLDSLRPLDVRLGGDVQGRVSAEVAGLLPDYGGDETLGGDLGELLTVFLDDLRRFYDTLPQEVYALLTE